MDYKTVESQKRLIVNSIKDGDYKFLNYLAGSKKTETLYLYSHSTNEPEDPDVYELGTSAEELTVIRDFMINLVSKIEKNYGLEQTAKILGNTK